MSVFTFNDGIPAANNNPSVDQPDMLENNQSTLGIIGVDHITFNQNNGGNHLQVHLTQFQTPTVVNGNATEGSVIYNKAGEADPGYAQVVFQNAHNFASPIPLSIIRAYGAFDSVPTLLNGFNITGVKNTSGGNIVYDMTIASNLTATNNFGVQATPLVNALNPGVMVEYNKTGISTFSLAFRTFSGGTTIAPDGFTVTVYQL